VADNDILNAEVGQHIGADLTGEGAGLLEVDVLGTDMDVGTLGLCHSSDQVGIGSADDDLAACVLHGGHQLVHQNSSLGGGLVHLPVASNNGLALCLIHDTFSLPYLPYK